MFGFLASSSANWCALPGIAKGSTRRGRYVKEAVGKLLPEGPVLPVASIESVLLLTEPGRF